MHRKTRTIIAALGITATASANAADFDVQPRAGLWKSTSEILVNGQDFIAQMQAVQERMLENLPPEAREAMGDQDSLSPESYEWVTAEQAQKMGDVEAWLAELEDEGNCEFRPTGQTETTVDFQGSCSGEGFTGDFTGQLAADSETSWHMSMSGSGEIDAGMGEPQTIEQQISVTSEWQGADCGDVQPSE